MKSQGCPNVYNANYIDVSAHICILRRLDMVAYIKAHTKYWIYVSVWNGCIHIGIDQSEQDAMIFESENIN